MRVLTRNDLRLRCVHKITHAPQPLHICRQNHSCTPTSAPVGNDAVYIALRDLLPGDEVTYDYACTETPESSHMPFECRCGAAECRGTVTGRDCLDPALRARYEDCFSSTVRTFQAAQGGAVH